MSRINERHRLNETIQKYESAKSLSRRAQRPTVASIVDGTTAEFATTNDFADIIEDFFNVREWSNDPMAELVRSGLALNKGINFLLSGTQVMDIGMRVWREAAAAQTWDPAHSFMRAVRGTENPSVYIPSTVKLFLTPAKMVRQIFRRPEQRLEDMANQLADTTPIIEGTNISMKMLIDQGLNTYDISIFPRRGGAQWLEQELIKRLGPETKTAAGKQFISDAMDNMRNGLFVATMTQAIMDVARYSVVPYIKRVHPDWSDTRISATAADYINVEYSAIAEWQRFTVGMEGILPMVSRFTSNPRRKELLENFLTSLNELRANNRMFTDAIGGEVNFRGKVLHGNKRENAILFRRHLVGLAVVTAILGSTGIGGLTSLRDFLRTDEESLTGRSYTGTPGLAAVPFDPRGSGGRKLYLDTVGQADTPARLLDPQDAIPSRSRSIFRILGEQGAGKTFYGEALNTPQRRAAHLITGLMPFAPVELLRATGWLDDSVLSGETRLGGWGHIIQAIGVNVRAEPNKYYRNRIAKERYGLPNYDDAEPWERRLVLNDPQVREEFRQDAIVGTRRGQQWATYSNQRFLIEDTRDGELSGIAERFRAGTYSSIRSLLDDYRMVKNDARIRSEHGAYVLGIDFDKTPPAQNSREQALQTYYSLSERFTDANTGFFDAEGYSAAREYFYAALRQHWPDFYGYVVRNTNFHLDGLEQQEQNAIMQMLGSQKGWATAEYSRIRESLGARQQAAQAGRQAG